MLRCLGPRIRKRRPANTIYPTVQLTHPSTRIYHVNELDVPRLVRQMGAEKNPKNIKVCFEWSKVVNKPIDTPPLHNLMLPTAAAEEAKMLSETGETNKKNRQTILERALKYFRRWRVKRRAAAADVVPNVASSVDRRERLNTIWFDHEFEDADQVVKSMEDAAMARKTRSRGPATMACPEGWVAGQDCKPTSATPRAVVYPIDEDIDSIINISLPLSIINVSIADPAPTTTIVETIEKWDPTEIIVESAFNIDTSITSTFESDITHCSDTSAQYVNVEPASVSVENKLSENFGVLNVKPLPVLPISHNTFEEFVPAHSYEVDHELRRDVYSQNLHQTVDPSSIAGTQNAKFNPTMFISENTIHKQEESFNPDDNVAISCNLWMRFGKSTEPALDISASILPDPLRKAIPLPQFSEIRSVKSGHTYGSNEGSVTESSLDFCSNSVTIDSTVANFENKFCDKSFTTQESIPFFSQAMPALQDNKTHCIQVQDILSQEITTPASGSSFHTAQNSHANSHTSEDTEDPTKKNKQEQHAPNPYFSQAPKVCNHEICPNSTPCLQQQTSQSQDNGLKCATSASFKKAKYTQPPRNGIETSNNMIDNCQYIVKPYTAVVSRDDSAVGQMRQCASQETGPMTEKRGPLLLARIDNHQGRWSDDSSEALSSEDNILSRLSRESYHKYFNQTAISPTSPVFPGFFIVPSASNKQPHTNAFVHDIHTNNRLPASSKAPFVQIEPNSHPRALQPLNFPPAKENKSPRQSKTTLSNECALDRPFERRPLSPRRRQVLRELPRGQRFPML
ncbi:hypothetical protein L204_105238 [Cryptococcus depauperatus]|nr:hypothetical protein L204_03887 [Cryptococcus depauperatus CBS 7855]